MALIAVDQQQWASCFLWLLLCFVIDALDGTLARRYNVDQVLTSMDGKSIDYVIDFATYAIIPTYFFYKAQMVPPAWMAPLVCIMLISSALYYGKKQMVEDEQYFVGFPVLWNFVVFYQFFVCQNVPWLNIISVIIFGLLHFVPIRYAYPSRSRQFFKSHLLISTLGLLASLVILLKHPLSGTFWNIILGIVGIYFISFAVYDTIRDRYPRQ